MAAPASKSVSLVQLVEIASPCTALWDDMHGDDRSRFCSHCKLNVYNLSAMTEEEGERLIIEKEGKLCARIYRRKDGTVLTKDCPIGLRAVRQAAMRSVFRTAAALIGIAITGACAVAGIDPEPKREWPDDECASVARELGIDVNPAPFTSALARVHQWLWEASATPGQWFAGDVGPPVAPGFERVIEETTRRNTERSIAKTAAEQGAAEAAEAVDHDPSEGQP